MVVSWKHLGKALIGGEFGRGLQWSVSGLEWSVSGLQGSVSGLEWSVSGLRWSVSGLRWSVCQAQHLSRKRKTARQTTKVSSIWVLLFWRKGI